MPHCIIELSCVSILRYRIEPDLCINLKCKDMGAVMSRGSAVSKTFAAINNIFKDIDHHKNEYMAMEFVGKDYTRNRKLPMPLALKSLFSFGCSSLHDEYNELYVHHKIDTSLCAFVSFICSCL